jgi:hypothetical protein
MPGFLRQSTASQTRLIGPFVDSTDFATPETGLTIANTDIKLSKNGAAEVNKNAGGGTHISLGRYAVTFDATDSNTVGQLHLAVSVAGALIVWDVFTVLEEVVYDGLYAAGAAGFGGGVAQSGDAYGIVANVTSGMVSVYEIVNNLVGADSTLSDVTKRDIADKLLARNQAGGSDGGRTVAQAFARMRNRQTIVGGVMRIYANDNTTVLYQAAVTTDANGFITELAPTT